HPEGVGQDELGGAVLFVLAPQCVKDLAGLRAVAVEEVLLVLSQSLGPLSAGPQRSVVGKVAQQVERVGLGLTSVGGEAVKVDATLLKLLHDVPALLRVGPLAP